jgi:hypothetical protein
MDIELHGKRYQTLCGSDLKRDGMTLELGCGPDTLAEIFYSDATGEFTVSLFHDGLPLPVIEEFIREAHLRLPPSGKT